MGHMHSTRPEPFQIGKLWVLVIILGIDIVSCSHVFWDLIYTRHTIIWGFLLFCLSFELDDIDWSNWLFISKLIFVRDSPDPYVIVIAKNRILIKLVSASQFEMATFHKEAGFSNRIIGPEEVIHPKPRGDDHPLRRAIQSKIISPMDKGNYFRNKVSLLSNLALLVKSFYMFQRCVYPLYSSM